MNIKIWLIFIIISLSFNAQAMTKNELFQKLFENNSMLKEEQLNLKATQSTSATNWAAPEFSISEMNTSTPFMDSKMKMQRSFELSQMLPNPFKISADKEIKKNNEKVQANQVSITLKKLRSDAYNLFLGIYQNQKELEILTSKSNQLDKFFDRLKSSQVQAQEDRIQIQEAQVDLSEIKLSLNLNQAEYKRMKSMLNQMLGLPLDNELTMPILDEVILSKNISPDQNAELKNLDFKINLMESDLSMKKSEFFPEFSIKAKINKSYSASLEDSKELMFGITLPFLFWGQQSNGVDNTRFKIEAMKHAKSNELSMLKSKSLNLKSEIEDLNATLKFLKESSMAVKEKKMKLFSNYSYTDMKSLMNYKMSFDDIYMLKMKILMKEIELQKKYFEWTELEG